MKVILVNGSRRKNGCTFTALTEVSEALKADGIESELFFIGDRAVNGEIDAAVKEVGEAMKKADGLIVGAPVYYASPSGEIIAFLDRLFMLYGKDMIFKPGSAITSARRAGTTASLDVMNKYFTYNQMPLVSSRYWNMVHGSSAEDVNKDEEGLQIMRVLGHNMAWLLKCIEAGKKAGLEPPAGEDFLFTNFIR
ncbi:MAG: flavodoxin family protein [Lachnospiraceae bacterium]|nr:flavodoxin family protein [Lachnospiraceae bacterium]